MSDILIFDDDKELCEELSELLKGEEYSVDIANHGDIGMDMLNKKDYGVVLLDLKMQDISGYQVLEWLKKERPMANVIVLTGSILEKDHARNKLLDDKDRERKDKILKSANYVMNKPFNIEILLDNIARLISGK